MTREEEEAALASGYLTAELAAKHREEEARDVLPLAWSPEEDAQLQALVEANGTGNWVEKAEAFDTERTANALRHRFAQVLGPRMGREVLAALKPKKPERDPIAIGSCAACRGAHKRHTCGKAKNARKRRKVKGERCLLYTSPSPRD